MQKMKTEYKNNKSLRKKVKRENDQTENDDWRNELLLTKKLKAGNFD